MNHSKRYLIVRDVVRFSVWMSAPLGVAVLVSLISPYI
jgi:hypothetical protein